MVDYKVSDSQLTSIASAIRTKGGTSANLSFPGGFVTAIGNISTGGSATLITKNIAANGTYNASSDSADGYSSVTVAVPGPPYVTGTFTPQASEANTVKSITIPYTGSGYPIACYIFPTPGAYKNDATIYTTAQKQAIVTYMIVKDDISSSPNYSSNVDASKAYVVSTYKNSDTAADSYTAGYQKNYQVYTSSNPTGGFYTYCVRFSSSTNMNIFIATTSVYGFLAGQEYTYQIVYSS